ncbi:exopolyphosphatase [Xylophilus sp. Kf1]|nr:exopolyphosphatase [Xylophilus sp. Kf1]
MSKEKYRLVTRSDFDGLVCAVLLKHLDMIDDIKFVHPKDMQDGKVEIGPRDITTNLPYVPGAYLVFDHHSSEVARNGDATGNYVIDASAPSAARVVYRHFGGDAVFPRAWDGMMDAVDKADAARFSREEILHPGGWVLLNYLMDSRTGLGRFRDFRISNYDLMMNLIDRCAQLGIDEIIRLPDVAERSSMYFEHQDRFIDQLRRCSTVSGNLIVLDLRDEEIIYAGNRFMIYALNPEANISIHVLWGREKQNTVFATGKSIINRSSNTNIGELMLRYGGGGHENAGTCQVDNDRAPQVLAQLTDQILQDG